MSLKVTAACAVAVLSLSIATGALAIDRSVALPYQYGSNVGTGGVKIPTNCDITQYVAVSGTALVCRKLPSVAIPDCGSGHYVTAVSGKLDCALVPSSTTVTVPTCDANQYLTGNGISFSCVAAPSPTTVSSTTTSGTCTLPLRNSNDSCSSGLLPGQTSRDYKQGTILPGRVYVGSGMWAYGICSCTADGWVTVQSGPTIYDQGGGR